MSGMVGRKFRPPGVTFIPGLYVIHGGRFMAWSPLPRVLLIVSVAYAAALLRPLPLTTFANVAVALALAALVLLLERRLRDIPIARVLGSIIGCAIGIGIARAL